MFNQRFLRITSGIAVTVSIILHPFDSIERLRTNPEAINEEAKFNTMTQLKSLIEMDSKVTEPSMGNAPDLNNENEFTFTDIENEDVLIRRRGLLTSRGDFSRRIAKPVSDCIIYYANRIHEVAAGIFADELVQQPLVCRAVLAETVIENTEILSDHSKNPFGSSTGDGLDGQGLTFGIQQMAAQDGELLKFFLELKQATPEVIREAISDDADYNSFMNMLEQEHNVQISWLRKVVNTPDGRIDTKWEKYFENLGNNLIFQKMQAESLASSWQIAEAYKNCEQLGFDDERAFMFFFDTANQNGYIKENIIRDYKNHFNLQENGDSSQESSSTDERLSYLAHRIADTSKFPKDVLSRKLGIAEGRGIIHKFDFILRYFGISKDRPVFHK